MWDFIESLFKICIYYVDSTTRFQCFCPIVQLTRAVWCGKVEGGAVLVKSRFVRGVGTASDASRPATEQVGVACQLPRPSATRCDAGPPTMSPSTQFPTQLWAELAVHDSSVYSTHRDLFQEGIPFFSLSVPSLLPSLPCGQGVWSSGRSPAAKRILVHFRHKLKLSPLWLLNYK